MLNDVQYNNNNEVTYMTITLSNSKTKNGVVKIKISNDTEKVKVSTILVGGDGQNDYKTISMSNLCSVLQNSQVPDNEIESILPQNHNKDHIDLIRKLIRICNQSEGCNSINAIKNNDFDKLKQYLEKSYGLLTNANLAKNAYSNFAIEIIDDDNDDLNKKYEKYHILF